MSEGHRLKDDSPSETGLSFEGVGRKNEGLIRFSRRRELNTGTQRGLTGVVGFHGSVRRSKVEENETSISRSAGSTTRTWVPQTKETVVKGHLTSRHSGRM